MSNIIHQYCRMTHRVFHVEQKVLTQDEPAILVEPHNKKKRI